MTPLLRSTIYNDPFASIELLENAEFTADLSNWDVGAGAGVWAYNAGSARCILNNGTTLVSDILRQHFTPQVGGLHKIKYSFDFSGLVNVTAITGTFRLYSEGVEVFTKVVPFLPVAGVQASEFYLRDVSYDEIGFSIVMAGDDLIVDMGYFRARKGIEVDEPGGIEKSTLNPERDHKYHSLVEAFQGDFVWTGSALDLIQAIEDTQGPAAIIEIFFDISFKESVYQKLYIGLIDVSMKNDKSKEENYYKGQIPVIRNDFWSKFMARQDSPVNLEGVVDLDNNARIPIAKITLPLPSQKMRTEFHGNVLQDTSYGYVGLPNGQYGQINFPQVTKDNVAVRFNLPIGNNATRPAWTFAVKYDGLYTFDIQVYTTTNIVLGDSTDPDLDLILQINDLAGTTLTKTDEGIPALDGRTKHTYTGSANLLEGDLIRIYFQNNTGGAYSWAVFANIFWDSYFKIIADTTYADTQTDSFLIKDAIKSVLSKTAGADDVLVSTLLDGCGGNYGLQKGQHVRGFTFTERPNFMSWNNIWAGGHPCFGWGFGYTEVDGVDKFELEKMEDFYDPVPALNLDNVGDTEDAYDGNLIPSIIKFGYKKGLSGSDSGIDSPQTQRTYNGPFPIIGKKLDLLSEFIASDLMIEKSRRNKIEKDKDDPNDEEDMIIALRADTSAPDGVSPEFDESFAAITGLLNSDARYNIRLSVARNYLRYRTLFAGCLNLPAGGAFNFGGGTGNYTMTSQLDPSDCEATDNPDPVVAEDQNMDAGPRFLVIPRIIRGSHPLSWEQYQTIIANRKKAIGISSTDSDHVPYFIDKFSYNFMRSRVNFVLWRAEVIPVTAKIFDYTFDYTFE